MTVEYQPIIVNGQDRRRFLGGTDIAAIVGKHKYRTALGVYAEKVLGLVDEEQSIMAMMGLALEPIVKIVAEKDLKKPILSSSFIQHPEYQFLAVNPDGELSPEEGAECKTHGYATRDEWGEEMTDEIPDAYHVQATWQCGLKGWQRCYVIAFDRDKGTNRYYCVEANQSYFESLVKIGVRFWTEHIVPKQEPKVASSEDLEVVKVIYRKQVDDLIIADVEHDEAAETYLRISDQISASTKERDLAKAILIQSIGEHEGIQTSCGSFTYKARTDGVRVFRAPSLKSARAA